MSSANQNDPNVIGKSFVKHYYGTYSSNRNNLSNLFKDRSMMTYESSQHKGQQSIMEKLTSLQFKTIKHDTKTMDVQPSGAGGLLIVVTGELFIDESKNGLRFCEVFHLMNDNGSFWIHNLVF
eukprot:UN04664